VFPELSDHYTKKHYINETTFLSDIIEEDKNSATWLDKNKTLDEYTKTNYETLTKLAIINYLMGNRDRHVGNFIFQNNKIKLFDEGETFCNNDVLENPNQAYIPHYTKPLSAIYPIDAKNLKEYFNMDKMNAIIDHMNSANMTSKEVDEFNTRAIFLHKLLDECIVKPQQTMDLENGDRVYRHNASKLINNLYRNKK
jgi:hypothetical protein